MREGGREEVTGKVGSNTSIAYNTQGIGIYKAFVQFIKYMYIQINPLHTYICNVYPITHFLL